MTRLHRSIARGALAAALATFALLGACAQPKAPDAPATAPPSQTAAPPSQAPVQWQSISVVYHCAGGVSLPVNYLNIAPDQSLAFVYHQSRLIPMQQVVSASGAQYAGLGEQGNHRWYTKGKRGWLGLTTHGRETLVLDDCAEATATTYPAK
ncbi:MAG: MliC family protein [Burkholderiaceae bacterium]|jgi:membrane-bound inhibitor of C-type lysozyme|nr:MliC family protein [Burkholderiaceae bacterium]